MYKKEIYDKIFIPWRDYNSLKIFKIVNQHAMPIESPAKTEDWKDEMGVMLDWNIT